MYYHNQTNNYENLMYIYLPIAEQPIHSLVIIGVGLIIGFIMGLVGVGGGFLLTPIMMFLGIPPPVAVASVANQLVAPSVSGVLSHWKRGNVDFKMGTVLLLGGVLGSSIGVILFNFLDKIGQLDLVIKLSYIVFFIFDLFKNFIIFSLLYIFFKSSSSLISLLTFIKSFFFPLI